MSTIYCPKCASQAAEGQRFCRTCGTNLGLILDAMAGKQRGPLDFESLKEDLHQLGGSLRSGFEEARENMKNMKKTHRFAASEVTNAPDVSCASWAEQREKRRAERLQRARAWRESRGKQKYSPRPRKYSLQQATLSIFSGGAVSLVLYNLLNMAASSGLLANLEQVLVRKLEMPEITGWVPVFQLLWLIGLIPVAKGFAHLINGIFFAPKPEKANAKTETPAPGFVKEMPDYITPGNSTPTNEFERRSNAGFQPSVTEDPTLQFAPRNPATSDQ